MRARRIKRWFALAGVNLVVLLVFAELGALTIHFLERGTLLYDDHPSYPVVQEVERGDLSRNKLHPFFGFLSNVPGTVEDQGLVANNFGFLSEHGDYPLMRGHDDQYFIGVFGGSVAQQLFVSGRRRLVESLKSSERFAGKEMVVLSFSQSGYKQPQQVGLLAYFLSVGQDLDMVINVDGFNEVVLGRENHRRGIDVSMPSSDHLVPIMEVVNGGALTPEKVRLLARVHRYKSWLNALRSALSTSRLASSTFVLDRSYRIVDRRYRQAVTAFNAIPPVSRVASPL